jgi:hypothetical protein
MNQRITYKERLPPVIANAKLNYIFMRWGISQAQIDALLNRSEYAHYTAHVSKHAKREFARFLGSIEEVFGGIERVIALPDAFRIKDPFFSDYLKIIEREGGQEGVQKYLSGEWDDVVVRAVSIAQRERMVPKRALTQGEQSSRVHFEPRPSYQGYFNR